MKLAVASIAVVLALKIEKLGETSFVFLPGGKSLFLPVKVDHVKPEHKYTVSTLCSSQDYDLTECHFSETVPGSDIAKLLEARKLSLPYKPKGKVNVVLTIKDINMGKEDKVEYELASPKIIALKESKQKVDNVPPHIFILATVPEPFGLLDLDISYNKTNSHYNLTLFDNKVQFQITSRDFKGTVEYTVKDKNSGLSSEPQKVEVSEVKGRNKRKIGIILIGVSGGLILLMLVAMLVQIKFKPFGRKSTAGAGNLNGAFDPNTLKPGYGNA